MWESIAGHPELNPDEVHVYPIGDLIEHDVDGGDCLCGPRAEPIPRADGSMGWLVTHHSLDGRELAEADAQ